MYRKKPQGWIKHLDFLILDIIVIQISYVLAYYLRHRKLDILEKPIYQAGSLLLLIATVGVAFFLNNYKDILRRRYLAELISVIELTGGVSAALIIYLFSAQRGNDFSRLTVGYLAVIGTILTYIERCAWKKYLIHHIASNEKYTYRILLLTTEDLAAEAVGQIRRESLGSLEIIGIILTGKISSGAKEFDSVPVVCRYEDAEGYLLKSWTDEVMIVLPPEMRAPEEFLTLCAEMGITTHVCFSRAVRRPVMTTVEEMGGYMVVTESIRIASSRALVIKRFMDICGSIIGLLVTGLLVVTVGPIIYFSDPGNIFFSQIRVGENGRKFKIYKFRSMYKDAEARKAELQKKNKIQGLMFKVEDDPRIIGSGPDGKRHGIGWFIRKTSIDEFPQFWNVLKGDMSMVGTRPPTVEEFEKYEAHHRARLAIRPGLTGLWQVSGRSDITDFEEVVELDLQYINGWTIGGDIKLLLKTIAIIFTGKGAE